MSEEAVHPDVRVGLGSLLAFVAVVLGTLLGYPLVGGAILLVGVGLLASGWTGSPLGALIAAAGEKAGLRRSEE